MLRRFAFVMVILMGGALLAPATSQATDDEPLLGDDGTQLGDQPRALRAAMSEPDPLVFVPEGATVDDTPTILIDGSKLFEGPGNAAYPGAFFALMTGHGYSVVVTLSGVLDEELSQYEVFMALTLFTPDPYSEAELNALDQYMAQGGNLFIAGEARSWMPSWSHNLSAISQRYADVRLARSTLFPERYVFSNFEDHPTMAGLRELFYRFGGTLTVGPSARTVAFSDNGSDALVAVNRNAVVVGDSTFLVGPTDSPSWNQADNTDFILNIFSYLINNADDGIDPPVTCASLAATITGTGDIVGTPGNDVIVGSSGPDTIDGRGGDDVICAGDGDDVVKGGAGADVIYAGPGDDRVNGQGNTDRLYGGPGDDVLWGNAGDDTLGGGPGDDRLTGGPGDDSLGGGPGNDFCRGSAGADRYFQCETRVV